MRIGGLQKTTLVDYPGKVAATVFTQGCNFRCSYCHNPELVLPGLFEPTMSTDDFFSFLQQRKGKLQAVCITGGEPTIHPDLSAFMTRIKDLGFLVKLDSNGTRPDYLEKLITQGLIDYLAMDIKAPLEKYSLVTQIPSTNLARQIERSISLIRESGIEYEFRTTVARPLLEVSDFHEIGRLIEGAPRYYLQNYQPSKNIQGEGLKPFTQEQLEHAQRIMLTYVPLVEIR